MRVLPIVPNTTQGNVFPSTNSRILVISNKRPPRNTIGPLVSSTINQSVIFRSLSYMSATPFPLAPLQAIKQHESGVVVITNPPNALEIGASG